MRTATVLLGVSMAACCFCMIPGCGGSTKTEPTASHEHDSHEHGSDEHGHDHDHATTIDADAIGLSADNLVSLDKPELPATFPEAVKELVALHDVIRDAFKSGNAEAAHGPLHDVGNLLGGIESMISSGEHDAEHQKELAAAVEELFDSYTAVDDKMFHAGEGKEYSEVEAKIDAAVKTLEAHVDHK